MQNTNRPEKAQNELISVRWRYCTTVVTKKSFSIEISRNMSECHDQLHIYILRGLTGGHGGFVGFSWWDNPPSLDYGAERSTLKHRFPPWLKGSDGVSFICFRLATVFPPAGVVSYQPYHYNINYATVALFVLQRGLSGYGNLWRAIPVVTWCRFVSVARWFSRVSRQISMCWKCKFL